MTQHSEYASHNVLHVDTTAHIALPFARHFQQSSSAWLRWVLLLATCISALLAQIPQGAIQGNVTDPTGAAIPNASVTLHQDETGIERVSKATEAGVYSLNYLNSGTYRLIVKAAGFKKAEYPGIRVQVGDKIRLDARLEVGDVSTAIEVKGAATLVQSESATVGSIVSTREVVDMPVRGREFSQLALLAPGVRSAGTTGAALVTEFATAVQTGGTSSGKNSYSVDGVDNTFNVWNGPAMNPSIDAIQEFRLERSQFSAEYGRGGAELQLVTKAGTNNFHGALWEYMRNKALNGGNYITHEQDGLRRNQYGANLGGPILKNRLFFFGNWEAQRERNALQLRGTVLTDAMRSGDLREYPLTVNDPSTGKPFPNNTIPKDRLNPVSLSYANAVMPKANYPGFPLNLIHTFRATRDWDQGIGRVDYQLSSKESLFFRASYQPRNGIGQPITAAAIAQGEDFSFFNFGAGYTRTWSPALVTETRFGLHKEHLLVDNAKPDQLPTNPVKGYGPNQPPPDRIHVFNVRDLTSFGQYGFPIGFQQSAPEFVQNASFFKQRHLIKVGYAGRMQRMNRTGFPSYWFNFNFNGTFTGAGPGDFLLGIPLTANELLGFAPIHQRYQDHSFFVQDDWKVTSRLTLNLGLRYELATLPSETDNLWGNLDPATKKVVVAGDKVRTDLMPDPIIYQTFQSLFVPATQTSLPSRTLGFGDHNNFSPRIGFAWRPLEGNKTVIRGGYGIFYLLEDGNTEANNTSNPPYAGARVSATNVAGAPTFKVDEPFAAGIAGLAPPAAYYRDPHMRSPYLQQTTLGVQRELPGRILADITFQDQNSKKLESLWNMNTPVLGSDPINSRRPFYDVFKTATIQGVFHEGSSRYNALESSIRRQSAHYTFQWSLTWAKNMVRSWVYAYDRSAFPGPTGYPLSNKVHFIADLPFGKGRTWLSQGGLLNQIVGGWTVSGFATFDSGQYLTVDWSGDSANVSVSGVRPTRIGSGIVSNPNPKRWIDPAAFTAPVPGTFGNSGTGILTGPSSRSFDTGIFKVFQIRETLRLQFRTEMFNAFNHPNLDRPQTTANGIYFGQILSKVQEPRVIQFALRMTF
jgi:outer membrane receptor protein involved in Fe transport